MLFGLFNKISSGPRGPQIPVIIILVTILAQLVRFPKLKYIVVLVRVREHVEVQRLNFHSDNFHRATF